ncbi:MAG: hypothetical protein IPM29_27860 [Planctomycetes bacterium]|nr:hypothetical protein [Planctomycetota bacterium]
MSERSEALPDAWLAHTGWMRELARHLLADPAAAEEVVQEAWVAALRHPPSPDRPLEPWLSRVVRNFASKRRRAELPDATNAHDDRLERFAATVWLVAASEGAVSIDLRAAALAYLQTNNRRLRLDGSLRSAPYGCLTYDGIHPNATGDAWLVEQCADGIRRALAGR